MFNVGNVVTPKSHVKDAVARTFGDDNYLLVAGIVPSTYGGSAQLILTRLNEFQTKLNVAEGNVDLVAEDLATLVTKLRTEQDEFKREVVRVAKEYAEEYDLCDTVDEALRTLCLDPDSNKKKFVVRLEWLVSAYSEDDVREMISEDSIPTPYDLEDLDILDTPEYPRYAKAQVFGQQ